MIKISEEIVNQLIKLKEMGYFSEYGAVIGDSEFIIYYADNSDEPYLAHISEFVQDGIFINLK